MNMASNGSMMMDVSADAKKVSTLFLPLTMGAFRGLSGFKTAKF